MGKHLVVVESPAKVKKIASFLGKEYVVMASMGHVRDLPARASEVPTTHKKKKGSNVLGIDVENDFEPIYIVAPKKKKSVQSLKSAFKGVTELIIATDADREGESIGWHLTQILKPKQQVKRLTFTEITKGAIQQAMQNPRKLNMNLVQAQETRRVLDRLYGYSLSPLLWKKVAKGLSAGRVQSVAVRVVVLREYERMRFRSAHFWDLKASLATQKGEEFSAVLVRVKNRKIATGKDFDEKTGALKKKSDVTLLNESETNKLCTSLKKADWQVTDLETSKKIRRPYPPFTTSTMQQEANRKLRLSARQTMQTAQRLYENGHITYMRTDSVTLSQDAIKSARHCIHKRYGKEYLSPAPRQFKTKSKSAQEAHEAIRPAGTEMLTADELELTGAEHKLYSLIWKRMIATQMADAQLIFQAVTITANEAEFRASGRSVEFPGFFRAYVEGVDDPEAALDDQEAALPRLSKREKLNLKAIEALDHETKPPARYTEATLVKTLEAEGIGRPSTYASIIGTIQERNYVRKVNNQLIPTFTAVVVTKLLEKNFPNLIDLGFTAEMEETLDEIATGDADALVYLKKFYSSGGGLAKLIKSKEAKIDARETCTLHFEGIDLNIRVGRFGPYLETFDAAGKATTVSIPPDVAPADLTNEMATRLMAEKKSGPRSLGMHPQEKLPVYVLKGPYGPYVQLGDGEDGKKPKRVSIPKTLDYTKITFEQALALCALPRTMGEHPDNGKPVQAGIGRFGPYVVCNGKYKSLGMAYDVLTIDLPTALELLSQVRARAGGDVVRELGKHPNDQGSVAIMDGRYGPYVKWGKVNATIPKDRNLSEVTLAESLEWLAVKASQPKKKGRRKK